MWCGLFNHKTDSIKRGCTFVRTAKNSNELHSLFISVSDQEMNLSVECAADLSPIISSEVTVDKEDGLWLIRTAIGGEDNA